MKETLRLGGVLLCITSICAGLLGVVNMITIPLIEQAKQEATTKAIQQLLPNATEVSVKADSNDELIEEVYIAFDGETYIGSVVKVLTPGYGDVIELMVGIKEDLSVAGIQILSHAETPGLGANMTQEHFVDQFRDKKNNLTSTKMSPKADEIQVITGATITTEAVINGVNKVLDYMREHQEDILEEGIK